MKLYWRFKRNGSWSWKPVQCVFDSGMCRALVRHDCVVEYIYLEEDE